MLKRFVAVVMLFTLPHVSAQADDGTSASGQDDVSVLRATLQSTCNSKDGYVLLSGNAVSPSGQDDMADVDESGAFDDLRRRNHAAVALPEGLACKGVRIRKEEDIQRFFVHDSTPASKMSLDDDWKKLNQAFPGSAGWMSVSLPGYAPSHDIAVVYVAHHCGSLCGQGTYVYLHRTAGQWKVLLRFPIWVS